MKTFELIEVYVKDTVEKRYRRGECSIEYGYNPSEIILGLEVLSELKAETGSMLIKENTDDNKIVLFGIPVEIDYEDPCRISMDGIEFAYVV